jgi:hypothetical protein
MRSRTLLSLLLPFVLCLTASADEMTVMEKGKKHEPSSFQGIFVQFGGTKVRFKTNDGRILEYSADAWMIQITFESPLEIYWRHGPSDRFTTSPVQPGRFASSLGSTTKDTDLQRAQVQQPPSSTAASESQPVDLTQCHGRGAGSDSIEVIIGRLTSPVKGSLMVVQNGVITFQQAQQKSSQTFREPQEVSSITIGSCN